MTLVFFVKMPNGFRLEVRQDVIKEFFLAFLSILLFNRMEHKVVAFVFADFLFKVWTIFVSFYVTNKSMLAWRRCHSATAKTSS